MSKEFELRLKEELPATPEEVWNAVATGPGNLAWLYPIEIEPWVGGVVSRGPCIVTEWDHPNQFGLRREDNDGFSMNLHYEIEARDQQLSTLRTCLRWVQEGNVDNGWDSRTEAATEHGQFFHHTLGQYLTYFKGQAATYVEVTGPPKAADANAFTVLQRALGLAADVSVGDEVNAALPGPDSTRAVLDYITSNFIGLRTDDTLYRFYGRNAWGGRAGLSLHLFAGAADGLKSEAAWQDRLAAVFASPCVGSPRPPGESA